MHYYQFNISDYKSHTEHLEPLEDLAYRRMLDWCYLHESPLPKDKKDIARLIRMRTHSDCIASVLREFFTTDKDGNYINKRVFMEISKVNEKSSKARESAKARWAKASSDANALQTECEGNATQDTRHKTQDTRPKKKTFVLPEWIDSEIWATFVEHRQKLKAPMTDRAKALIIGKLEKQSHQANAVLSQSIENGWKGVFDLKEENSNGQNKDNFRSRAQKVSDRVREIAREDFEQNGYAENVGSSDIREIPS